MKRFILLVISLLLVFTAAACSESDGKTETATGPDPIVAPETATETESQPEPEPEAEPEAEAYTGPYSALTGLPTDNDLSARRPFAFMLNNLKIALPQAGIGSADLIYEAVVEGGITRIMAVYEDVPDIAEIGSVRSSRHYFLDMAQGLDAIYIHAGGSNYAYAAIKSRGITNIDGVNGSDYIFYRNASRRKTAGYEHSLMALPSKIPEYVEMKKLRTEHKDGYECNMVFTDEPQPDGESAESVTVKFSSTKNTSFEYDSENQIYLASQNGSKYVDALDGEQVSVKNIVIVYAEVYQIAGDTAGRMDTILTGSGKGYFACEGKYVPITWSKDTYSSQFVFKLKDGTTLNFGRGVSYFGIVADGNTVTFK